MHWRELIFSGTLKINVFIKSIFYWGPNSIITLSVFIFLPTAFILIHDNLIPISRRAARVAPNKHAKAGMEKSTLNHRSTQTLVSIIGVSNKIKAAVLWHRLLLNISFHKHEFTTDFVSFCSSYQIIVFASISLYLSHTIPFRR